MGQCGGGGRSIASQMKEKLRKTREAFKRILNWVLKGRCTVPDRVGGVKRVHGVFVPMEQQVLGEGDCLRHAPSNGEP